MSLDYVRKGEAVKASTVNSIIDTIGGNQSMSPDLNVTTTARGPQISMPSKYGGPNQKPDHILDVGRYMLSNWPMVKLQLGFKLDDCLGAIKYHRADGTTSTPVTAAVVYQNSENCPTGSDISCYALDDSYFGKDAAAHAAGWVDTMIEDPYPGGFLEAQLWKYKSGTELTEVFTNVNDQISVQQQLSTVLQTNGANEEDLSTLNIVGQWKLLDSTILSVKGQYNLVPTHEIVCKNGIIDVYETSMFDYNVVLKASLECIDVQKDGSGDVTSTIWAWKIPLGPDATCIEGKAHSNSVTYGGNEVVFEVQQGEIGSNFNGEATYNGKAIWYGRYEVKAGEELLANEVWLNLSYDYQIKATKGIFSSSKSSGSYTQDGILNRNVFVVKLSSFKPGAEVAKGDRAPAESIEYGTWGALPKDGPKLDTYCQKDSYTSFKSLDWANREGETVECQCAELYEFDQLSTVDPISTDHLVIRRVDENNGAELKYISLSSLEISGMYVPPDADVQEAQTSSIQTRELDNGSKVEQLFQFNQPETVDVRISDLVSVDVVLRNPNNGNPCIEYGKLCIDIATDSQGQTGQKSIDRLSSTNELQLYKFNENGLSAFKSDITVNGNREYLLPNEYEFVLRKNGAGGEVTYGQVALSVKMEELSATIVSGDSQVLPNQKSIQYISKNGEDYYQLYDMDKVGTSLPKKTITMSADGYTQLLPNDYEFVLRQNGAGGKIKYANLSCCIPNLSSLSATIVSGDNEVVGTRKSIDFINQPDSDQYYQLHDFQTSAVNGPNTFLKFQDQPLNEEDFSIGCQTQFVVRVPDGNNGYEVKYMQLSAYQEHERVDTREQYARGHSIDYTAYNKGYGYGCYSVLQLQGFDAGCSYFITSADISSRYGNGILIRKFNEDGCYWQLDYMNFDSLDELAIKYIGDSQLSLSAHNPYSKSTTVWWDEYDQKKYVELYGFKSDFQHNSVTIQNDGCTYYWPQNVRTDKYIDEFDYILVKHVDSDGNISLRYTQLQVQMPNIAGLEGDITSIYNEINDIHIDIQYLSGCIDILSGELSVEGWESGGDSSTCYGSNIGNNKGNVVIDLDETTLSGSWKTSEDFTTGGNHHVGANLSVDYDGYVGGCLHVGGYVYAGCGFCTGNAYFTRIGAYVEGPVTITNGSFNVGCAYLEESSLKVGCSITIGSTSLDESQLKALLQLVNAPQMLQNL